MDRERRGPYGANMALRRGLRLLTFVIALVLALSAVAPTVADQGRHKPTRPDRVVVIVVDALSRELVQKYQMRNVQQLMRDGVNASDAYLGHLGSVTVVTHNVITSGLYPKHMGWTSEGYRDADGILLGPDQDNPFWLSSDWGADQIFDVQQYYGYPKLADYLHSSRPGSKVVTISPKGYAGYAFGGAGSDSIVTFSGRNYDCDGDGVNNWRGPGGINVPGYLSDPVCGRFYVDSSSAMTYDTWQSPARMYPLDGNRYTAGHDDEHLGSDVWAADAAIAAMDNEKDWSGIFVTLPGVDKAAHMWGGVIDREGEGLAEYEPMTHVKRATEIADQQVGKIVNHLRKTGQLGRTLVVLTADHGQVPAVNFAGVDDGSADRGYYNWYYGEMANGTYLDAQPALQPLVDTGNVGMTYSDSMVSAWLKDQSPAKKAQAARIMARMPYVSAVWVRKGDRFVRVGRVRWERMRSPGERAWFATHAQELLNTAAAPYGADVIATLIDDTTYSVAGDHGGIQRRSQQIPIVFAGANLSSKDLRGGVRSVDITPTVLAQLGIKPTARMDGRALRLPQRYHR